MRRDAIKQKSHRDLRRDCPDQMIGADPLGDAIKQKSHWRGSFYFYSFLLHASMESIFVKIKCPPVAGLFCLSGRRDSNPRP